MSYQEFPHDVIIGGLVLIDDGKIKLEVIETNKKDMEKQRSFMEGHSRQKKG